MLLDFIISCGGMVDEKGQGIEERMDMRVGTACAMLLATGWF